MWYKKEEGKNKQINEIHTTEISTQKTIDKNLLSGISQITPFQALEIGGQTA